MAPQSSSRILAIPDCSEESTQSSGPRLRSGGVLNSSTSRRVIGMNATVGRHHSHTRGSSLGSFLDSQTSLASESGSSFSYTSLQSQTSVQSQMSIRSQVSVASQSSLQSEATLLSQSSLASLPSLWNLSFDAEGKPLTTEYKCVQTLNFLDGHVSALAVAGEHLYSGFGSQNIRVWCRMPDLVQNSTFGSGDGAVKALVLAEGRVFSAHQDKKIRVWKKSKKQPAVHKLIATLPTVRDYIMSCIPPTNHVQVRRHHKRLWIEHIDTISVLAVAGNGVLYSGSWDRTVKVWSLSNFKCLESFKAHDDAINALVVSVDGFVYTGSADAKIKVWTKQDCKKHSLVTTMEIHKSAVNALALSPDGSLLYSAACDRAIVVWEREDSAQHMVVAGALRGHRRAILCLATVGDILCSGSADETIRVWRRQPARRHFCVAVLHGHRGPVKCLTVTLNERIECQVYSGSLNHDIKVWLLEGGEG